MRKLLTVITLLAALSVTATAQQPMPARTPMERAQNQVHWMQEHLNLTHEQNRKAYDIMLRYARLANATRRNEPGPGRRQSMHEIQRDKNADLKAILTGEQFRKYKASQREMRQQRQENRPMRQEMN